MEEDEKRNKGSNLGKFIPKKEKTVANAHNMKNKGKIIQVVNVKVLVISIQSVLTVLRKRASH